MNRRLVLFGLGVGLVVLLILLSNPDPNSPTSMIARQQNLGAPGSSNLDPDASGPFVVPLMTPVPGSGGTATTGGSGASNPIVELSSVPPRLPHAGQPETENDRQIDPLTPIDLNPVIKTTAPTASEVNPPSNAPILPASSSRAPAAPNDFYYYQAKDLGGGGSMIGETSHASNGLVVLETWNWGAALSKDGGKTWGFLNPYTLFPSSYGGFCCDQVVYYDQSHDITFWILQYSPNASNNNAIRLAWANGIGRLSNANFCYTDFTPQQLGSPSGTNYDQPKFARSDNNLYLEMTQYGAAGGSIVIRVAISAFTTACGGVGYQWYAPGLFSPGFTQRGYSDMYFAAHVSNSTLRVFDWPESAANWTGIISHDVSHTAYPANYPFRCPRTGGNATSDWCQRRSFGGGWAHSDRIFTGWQAGGVLTFVWDASQGNNGVGGSTFAYPYTHVVRINQGTFTLINEPIKWSSSFAIQYATAALSDRLHVAGTVMWGGGSYFENCATYIADDLSPGYTGIGFFPSGGWEWYNALNSNIDPSDTLSGDYFATRRNDYAPYTWGGSCYALLNGIGGVSMHPFYLWFGRGRDTPVIETLFLPLVIK
ncbi:MAG: hypothetical protein HZB51_04080 [Chloroflexi bacterium]|nr:hypothetical protein [Chloroflexota bacterium]